MKQKHFFHRNTGGKICHWLFLLLVICSSSSFASSHNPFSIEENAFLDKVQQQTFRYFSDCMNPANGLVMDKALNLPAEITQVDFAYSPATIAGVGFALTVIPVGVERGWITNAKALEITRTTLKFFLNKMVHKHGFFYHFVDMKTGKRAMNCEISSIDTAIFIAGALFAAQYFADPATHRLALQLYSRINWVWMCNGNKFVSMGWTPEKGFIPAAWDHYSEGLLLYILAMGSPTHPVPPESWNFQRIRGKYKDFTYLINPPLFTHQFPQVWLDLRNKRDNFADYFENSRQATLANHQFCQDMRPSFKTFSETRWGLTACIGPNEYQAYGAPPNPAIVDGTVAPAAAACSIVFTPDLSMAALREFYENKNLTSQLESPLIGRFGLSDSFNLDRKFVASESFAINQGPMLLMIENARSEFVWKTFMKIPWVVNGMQKAGFTSNSGKGSSFDEVTVYETAAYMHHRRPVYQARKIAETFSSECAGFDDPAWNSALPMIIDKSFIQTLTRPPAHLDFWILWRMLYNRKSLFFKFDVHDQDLHIANPEDKMYLDDCVEIYLNSHDLPFNWGGEHNFQIIFSPTSDGKELRIREFFKGDRLTASLKWKYERLPTGYRVIIEIPREEFQLAGVSHFAASIAAHDINANGDSDVKYNWFFTLPSMMLGRIELLKSLKNW